MKRRLPTCLLLSSLLVGCATGEPPSIDEDMTSDMSTTPVDMPTRPRVDMTPDPPEDMGPPRVCEPGMTGCTDDGQLVTCKPDGSGFTMSDCPERQECAEGQCLQMRVCEDGFTVCEGPTTRRFCRPGGLDFASEECGQGLSCVAGACVSGARNGSTCAANMDCAGGTCHCGDDEACAAPLTPGYCTASCDAANPCSEAEWCLAGDVHNVGAPELGYNHCVPKCEGSCSNPDFECKSVPTYDDAGALSWQTACYFDDAGAVGEECTSDSECVSGTCLQGYFNTGFCTRRCEMGGCPSNAACIELRPGEQWCTLTCGSGQVGGSDPCPLDVPTDRFDVTCSVKQVSTGGVQRVCVKP